MRSEGNGRASLQGEIGAKGKAKIALAGETHLRVLAQIYGIREWMGEKQSDSDKASSRLGEHARPCPGSGGRQEGPTGYPACLVDTK